MTEELITVLSQVHGLRVIARTSVDHYRGGVQRAAQIGRELGVGSMIEGSVRIAGDPILADPRWKAVLKRVNLDHD